MSRNGAHQPPGWSSTRPAGAAEKIPRVRRQQRAAFFSGQTLLALSPDEEEREYGEDAMEEDDAALTHTTTIAEEALLTGPASAFVASPLARGDEDEDEELSLSDTSASLIKYSSWASRLRLHSSTTPPLPLTIF
ncbi:Hypothetical predicted protein [Scomber scombrus]|uniref:Uncharacterized protein n=1 Tax=Scomber scombrus TaxID=13677 RepID=A0AAV1Q2N6_SCOSC